MKYLIVISLLLFAEISSAQEKISLQQAIETGLKNNYGVLIAKNVQQQSANTATPGDAGMLPYVSLNGSYVKNVNNTDQVYSSGSEIKKDNAQSDQLSSNAQLSWTLFDGLKMFATYSKLKELEAMGELQAKQVMENTVEQIIQSYFNIVQQEALLRIADTNVSISRFKFDIAQTKFQIGLTSKIDYLQAQLDLNADLSLLKNQELTLLSAKVDFNRLLSQNVSMEPSPTDSIEIIYHPSIAELNQKVQQQNTTLQVEQRSVDISRYMVRELEGQRYPRISFNAGYSYTRNESDANFLLKSDNNGYNYGFTATIPIFSGFTLNHQIRNAGLDLKNAELNLSAYHLSLDGELLVAYRSFENNIELLKMENDNSSLAAENLNLVKERYRSGLIDELNFRQAQQSYTQALTRLVSTKYNSKVAEVHLQLLAGELIK